MAHNQCQHGACTEPTTNDERFCEECEAKLAKEGRAEAEHEAWLESRPR